MTDAKDTPLGPEDEDDVLAAELALRLLEGADAEAAERRALTDRAFAARVAAWNARLVDLTGDVAPVPPGTAARRDLLDRLFAEPAAPAPVASGAWRLLGLGGIAASAVLAIALAASLLQPPERVYVSQITSEDGSFQYVGYIDAETRTIRLIRRAGSPPAEGSMELWGHAPDEPPVSFGVIPADDVIVVPVPDVLRADADGLIIAVSNEPEGGSPTGQPTGTVLGAGQAREL